MTKSKSAVEKIGIFGGTFSPPHIGHVNSAKDFLREIQLDELFVIPTYQPPHKEYGAEASADERLEMTRLAFSGVPKASVSDLEIMRGGMSYTYLTLEELSREDREIFLLCGTDMLLTLSEWKNAERIFELATICYVRRENDAQLKNEIERRIAEYRERYGARVITVSNAVVEISSTELRKMLKERSGAEKYLPRAVYEYILEKGLYL